MAAMFASRIPSMSVDPRLGKLARRFKIVLSRSVAGVGAGPETFQVPLYLVPHRFRLPHASQTLWIGQHLLLVRNNDTFPEFRHIAPSTTTGKLHAREAASHNAPQVPDIYGRFFFPRFPHPIHTTSCGK
ncbi:hypothetical protein ACSV5G_01880 [Agrobacterium cavarae]|uniref:hypothetical protein n=1 Tax=Agrobacterium cavarae TaxID=2528239 RepID=UPI0013AEAD36